MCRLGMTQDILRETGMGLTEHAITLSELETKGTDTHTLTETQTTLKMMVLTQGLGGLQGEDWDLGEEQSNAPVLQQHTHTALTPPPAPQVGAHPSPVHTPIKHTEVWRTPRQGTLKSGAQPEGACRGPGHTYAERPWLLFSLTQCLRQAFPNQFYPVPSLEPITL